MPRPDSAVSDTEGWAPQMTTTSVLLSFTLKISWTALSAMDWSSPP